MLHGKFQNIAEQRTLLYGLSAIGVTVLLSLHTFVTSTLSHVPSAMLGFLLNTLAVVLTVVFASKKLTPMALHSAVFMAVLLLGSNSTVLISTYNIGSEVGNLGLWMGIRSCGMLLLAAITWVGISLLERWQEDGTKLPVQTQITGILRGLLRDGYPVTEHFKVADVDPRKEELSNCFLISDKARCIAGSILELVCAQLWK